MIDKDGDWVGGNIIAGDKIGGDVVHGDKFVMEERHLEAKTLVYKMKCGFIEDCLRDGKIANAAKIANGDVDLIAHAIHMAIKPR